VLLEPRADGLCDALLVGSQDKRHLRNCEEQADCLERLDDRLGQATVEVVDEDDNPPDIRELLRLQELLELTTERFEPRCGGARPLSGPNDVDDIVEARNLERQRTFRRDAKCACPVDALHETLQEKHRLVLAALLTLEMSSERAQNLRDEGLLGPGQRS
jgi:hypothetical protein